MQCRGQVEGGVAQAIGAALYEDLRLDEEGRVVTQTFRHYHIPACADVPATEVFFADTHDSVGPLGAKSMSESPFNPVAAALANAIRDATGARLSATPFAPDRIFRAVIAAQAAGPRGAGLSLALRPAHERSRHPRCEAINRISYEFPPALAVPCG